MSTTRRRVVEERLYYSPPALRKQNHKQSPSKLKSSTPPEAKAVESGSNLDRFLEHTTPSVRAQHFSKTTMKAWRNRDLEFHPFFTLGDLWESFREQSVYGTGVPLVMNGSESVNQYYAPYLSGIQLYVDPARRLVEQRPGEESDANSSRETSSDAASECENDRGASISRGSHGLAGRDSPSMGSSTGRDDVSNPPGQLVYEYFETVPPYQREPLTNMISKLALRFPELNTYRSCDLTSSSWISVAWYPIYRIPVGSTLQNIEGCFLTFHSLAKPAKSSERDKLALPTFGLVPYKFKISDWAAAGIYESQKVDSLVQAADNWLRSLQVYHPDYTFFVSNNHRR